MKQANVTEGKLRVKPHIQRTKKDGSELPAYPGAPWRGVEKGHMEGSQKTVHRGALISAMGRR